MILNKFIHFISRAKTRYISCTRYQFCAFQEASSRFATSLMVQDKRKLSKNEINTSKCTTQSSGKDVNG